ncbi:hydroxyisourate hydrolase [Marinospirillum alkaliphilum]|uniref:5-hydroxyisourate hydrolase n=1 Tax=Marinospirillum alkaliphilum DSM 21637 TaxID=1122209 RepID=A0A1K1YIH9_9GAMM|nr:hydroxyisourate hydrolase [Marinospirillum alkaliphilum]SFX61582.1 5-hydroxyisourate hydrolase [Marinospirillum alkaliphilum DSM 21637]
MPSPITAHVLDTTHGRPAVGMKIQLYVRKGQEWQLLAEGKTNKEGRITDWLDENQRDSGHYLMVFATGEWYNDRAEACFYPQVKIEFLIAAANEHHHLPLMISPYGYSTYRCC